MREHRHHCELPYYGAIQDGKTQAVVVVRVRDEYGDWNHRLSKDRALHLARDLNRRKVSRWRRLVDAWRAA